MLAVLRCAGLPFSDLLFSRWRLVGMKRTGMPFAYFFLAGFNFQLQ